MIFIGADGGGTGTTLAAYENHRLLARGESGPVNYRFRSPADAARALSEGILSLGIDLSAVSALGLADPSLDDRPEEGDTAGEAFYRALGEVLPFPIFARSDAYITLFALTGGEGAGVLLISGTGSMGIAENAAGEIRFSGGWGRLTGDEGSGYYIALEGIRAALAAFDGIGGETSLTDAVLSHFGAPSPRSLIGIFYGDPAPEIAPFARQVARCAEEGDAAALAILERAARILAAHAAALVRFCREGSPPDTEIPVGIWGSVLTKNTRVRAGFEKKLGEEFPGVKVTLPPHSAEEAAARYAEKILNEKG